MKFLFFNYGYAYTEKNKGYKLAVALRSYYLSGYDAIAIPTDNFKGSGNANKKEKLRVRQLSSSDRLKEG